MRPLIATVATAAVLGVSAPVHAQDQSVVFSIGYFTLRGVDSRASTDTLNANLCLDVSFRCEPLLFEIGDFGGAVIGGEYLLSIGNRFEAAAGIGYYQNTVPSIYEDVTEANGSEIEQDLKLRLVPFTATVRFVPTGVRAPVQPYVGGGIGVVGWRYSESGEFVDTADYSVFRSVYEASGTEVMPVVLGGVRFRTGGHFAIGGEVRYQHSDVDLPEDFLGPTLDIGGFSYLAVFQLRF